MTGSPSSTVEHRYAITEVRATIQNPATTATTFNFGYVIPRTAFISKVTIFRWEENFQMG